jgi:hypothetical protein
MGAFPDGTNVHYLSKVVNHDSFSFLRNASPFESIAERILLLAKRAEPADNSSEAFFEVVYEFNELSLCYEEYFSIYAVLQAVDGSDRSVRLFHQPYGMLGATSRGA